MGKGDKKTKKGKISMGSFGVTRPRKKTKTTASPKAESKSGKGEVKEKKAPAKKTAAKKVATEKPATEKKAPAKKTKKEE